MPRAALRLAGWQLVYAGVPAPRGVLLDLALMHACYADEVGRYPRHSRAIAFQAPAA
ncbi:MAG TPA: hypothetical protein VM528_08860 [Burkholderiaceae bacterium]|nr:hypothetical protein [Burkholderiaceae bacterium]